MRALFLLLTVVIAACAPSDEGLTVDRLGESDTLVYYDSDATAVQPVVVLAHGCCGDNTDLAQLALTLAQSNVVVFNAGWTNLRSGAPIDTSATDILCSVARARDRAPEFGGDPGNVTLVAWSDAAGVAAYGLRNADRLGESCDAAMATPDRLIALSGVFGSVDPDVTAQPDLSLLAATGQQLGVVSDDLALLLLVGRKDEFKSHNRHVGRAVANAGGAATVEILPGGHTDLVSPRTPGGQAAVERILQAVDTP